MSDLHSEAENPSFPTTTAAFPQRREAPRLRSERSPRMVWSGRVLSGLFSLFMLGASATPKLLQLPVAEATMAELGWPAGYAFSLGVLEVGCVVLYLVPRTSILGAVLTMSLLGGAMATHLRAQSPLLSHALFPVVIGLIMWGGLWLRTPALRELFPLFRGAPGASSPRANRSQEPTHPNT